MITLAIVLCMVGLVAALALDPKGGDDSFALLTLGCGALVLYTFAIGFLLSHLLGVS